MTRLNWFQKLLFSVNAVCAALLGCVILTHQLPPSSGGYLYLLALGFPVLFLINFFFALWWLIRKKLHAALSILLLVFAIPLGTQWFSFNVSSGTAGENDVKLMSFNVRRFNQFKWIDNTEITQQILAYIKEEDPDIITFQEFINHPYIQQHQVKWLKELGYKHFKLEPRSKQNTKDFYFGLATFSKYPITQLENGYEHTSGDKPIKSAFIVTHIKVGDQKLAIFNCHLNSLKFGKEDYQFIENVSENEGSKEVAKKSKSIASKVMVAAKKREKELLYLQAQIKSCDLPVMVTGDFNEPPTSFAYTSLIQQLNDPFNTYGFGLQPTFDGIKNLPGLRLDHVLTDTNLITTSYQIGPAALSDHRPVVITFHFAK